MTASEKTWEACRSEILSLLDEIDAPSSEIHGTNGFRGYSTDTEGDNNLRWDGRKEA